MKIHLLLLLTPTFLLADALGDLRLTLDKLQSGQPLKARVEIQTNNRDGEKKPEVKSSASVVVESGDSGLKMSWQPEQIRLARLDKLKQAADPDAPAPNAGALKVLSAADAYLLLDYAESLHTELEGATLVDDRPDTLAGKPVRLLVIKQTLRMDKDSKEMMKSAEKNLKLWLDAEGFPLAMEQKMSFKGSKFLVTFKMNGREERQFQRVGGRLVVTRAVEENSASGMGMSNTQRKTITVTLF